MRSHREGWNVLQCWRIPHWHLRRHGCESHEVQGSDLRFCRLLACMSWDLVGKMWRAHGRLLSGLLSPVLVPEKFAAVLNFSWFSSVLLYLVRVHKDLYKSLKIGVDLLCWSKFLWAGESPGLLTEEKLFYLNWPSISSSTFTEVTSLLLHLYTLVIVFLPHGENQLSSAELVLVLQGAQLGANALPEVAEVEA